MEFNILKRRIIRSGKFIFIDKDRDYRSETFTNREARDIAINNYTNNLILIEKERQIRIKKEKELNNE